MGLLAHPAGADEVATYAGPANVAQPALAFRATISIPLTLPTGSRAQYAWVMATSRDNFTQVGWAWWPGRPPQVFAYTAGMADTDGGTWALGPDVNPGDELTVQITRSGGFLQDQYQTASAAWSTVQTALVSPTEETFLTDIEDYGPPMLTCFTYRGWESAPQVWHHLAGGCF